VGDGVAEVFAGLAEGQAHGGFSEGRLYKLHKRPSESCTNRVKTDL
jgi:hypothetical protein